MAILKKIWHQVRLTFDPSYKDKDFIEITNLPIGEVL